MEYWAAAACLSIPPALECLSLSPHGQAALQPAVLEVNCVSIYFPLLFLLSSETYTLVSKRIHPCWLSLGFQVFSWLGGASQPWVDPRLLFCECFSLVVCFPLVCQCYMETPSILGRHRQHTEIGLETRKHPGSLNWWSVPLSCGQVLTRTVPWEPKDAGKWVCLVLGLPPGWSWK